MQILAIGECMAELSPAEKTGKFKLGFAGDTFNTAWYLARLCPNADVAFYTAVGTDPMSKQMREAFGASGIEGKFVQTIQDKSVGLYLINLDKGERSFSYWRGQSAAREMINDPTNLITAVESSDVVYFSGITLAILDIEQRTRLLNILQTARANGKMIAFDPNLRPRLWRYTDVMTKAIMQGAAVSDLVMPSFEDEADWFNDASPEDTSKRYFDVGAKTVVVKNGSAAVHFRTAESVGEIPAKIVEEVVDTTAAGDSFNAEIIAGMFNNGTLEESIERACQLAAFVVQGRGALVSIEHFKPD